VTITTGEDFLLRPVLAGLCKYESLKDGSLDLADIALMNEALDVQAENQRRLEEALQRAR
jgi:hypothetical protein